MFGPVDESTLRTSVLKFFLRYLVIGVMCAPFGLIALFIPYTANLAIIVIFKGIVPIIGGVFILYCLSTWAFNKLNLINPIPSPELLERVVNKETELKQFGNAEP